MSKREYVGVVLAGGKSSRYGKPKMFATFQGKQFYEIAYESLRVICDDIVIVTNDHVIDQFPPSYRLITDEPNFVGQGPLAGIYSSMKALQASRYIVLPCDMPLVTSEIIDQLRSYHTKDVTVVQVNGKIQPLVSIWNHHLKHDIFHFLQSGKRQVKQLLDRVDKTIVTTEMLNVSSRVFTNVNTQQDDEELKKWSNW